MTAPTSSAGKTPTRVGVENIHTSTSLPGSNPLPPTRRVSPRRMTSRPRFVNARDDPSVATTTTEPDTVPPFHTTPADDSLGAPTTTTSAGGGATASPLIARQPAHTEHEPTPTNNRATPFTLIASKVTLCIIYILCVSCTLIVDKSFIDRPIR